MKDFKIIRCVDVETTGEDPAKDGAEVCEIGWCDLLRGNSSWEIEPSGPRSMLVKPTKPIPAITSAIHHIVDVDVEGAPPFSTAAQALFKDAADVVLCAHNARFERMFITTPATWICSYKCAVMLAPNAPKHKLQVLRYWLKLLVNEEWAHPPHRAGADAYVSAVLMQRMLKSGKMTLEQMIDLADRPIILPRLHFGKHEGEPLEAVPTGYLRWILDRDKHEGFDEDVEATARYHINQRQTQESAR